MERKRVYFTIGIDLDPVPGAGDSSESWEEWLVSILGRTIDHYHPTVTAVAKSKDSALRYDALRPTKDAFRHQD